MDRFTVNMDKITVISTLNMDRFTVNLDDLRNVQIHPKIVRL